MGNAFSGFSASPMDFLVYQFFAPPHRTAGGILALYIAIFTGFSLPIAFMSFLLGSGISRFARHLDPGA